ncbi:NAD-P-binding protein [Epithele typhae]|uniref:NAD-P-binding protein n=1 Tax=Epithele typhae TaxID=378194 RepID=UPI002008CCA9|nr:NAD-P-binding protein [Epithele typhae]KAH9915941.1 NAD-P-binding protein [Epithele typhae]
MVSSYAIIGASRGIGLEFVVQLASKPTNSVFAVVRNGAISVHLQEAIKKHGFSNVHVIEGDIGDYSSCQRAAKEVAEKTGGGLDCLIHNAMRPSPPVSFTDFLNIPDMTEFDADLTHAFQINGLGTIHSIHAFLPLLRASPTGAKKIAVISTEGGKYDVIRDMKIAAMPSYHLSKSVQVMAALKWSVLLAPECFTLAVLTPGLVDTSGTKGGLDAEGAALAKAVEAMLADIEGMTPEKNGQIISIR